jgi:flagellar M-ring protein FliF
MAVPAAPAAPGIAARLQALPSRNRIALMVALAAGIAAIVAALLWARTPDYRVLFSNVSDRDGGAIVQALGQMNVPYRLAEGGGAILVPSGKVHEVRLRLASLGLPRGGTVGFELMENAKFGTTQFQEQVNYQRALEGELARSIQSLASVASARVHLAIPKPSVFLRDAQKPTASVLVNLHAGQTLERAQISGIVHLVASSVPELPVKSVSVVDQSGALLSGEGTTSAGAQLDPTQLAYVAAIERGYAKRIEDILEPIVGRQNVRAQVTADIDFSESEATAESYRPNQNPQEAAVRSQQVHESANGGGSAVGGVPGALTNQPAPAATAPIGASPQAGGFGATGTTGTGGAASTRKESTVNYEVDKTVRHTRAPVGSVRRLSAAVVVNHRRVAVAADAAPAAGAKADKADKAAAARAAAAPKSEPLAAEEMAKIAALAKEAIGYSQQRGDTLEVVNAAFAGADVEAAAEVPMWRDPRSIALLQDLGKPIGAALIVAAVLIAVVRPAMRTLAATAAASAAAPPAQVEVLSATAHPSAYESNLASAKQLARKDPKVVANVVRQWVSGDE